MTATAVRGTTYYAAQNDRRPDLIMVLKDINGAVDLTASTAVEVFVDFPSAIKKYTATKDPDQITNKGRISYSYAASDIPDAGEHRMRTRVTWAAGVYETFPNNTYDVLSVTEGFFV